MKDKPAAKLALAKEEVGQKAQTALDARQSHDKAVDAAMKIGAIGMMNTIAEKLATQLSSQALRALEHFAETKGHEALGFERFDDFLNESPYSPMTKHQYYERRAVLDKESDQVFDVLNSMRIPVSARKLLTEGAVQIEGDEIVVGGNVRVPINNAAAVKNLIKELASETARQSKKIERGEEQNKKLKKKLDERKQAGNGAALSDYDQALLNLLGAYSNLVALAFELKDPERLEKRDYTFARLADQRLQLEEALGVHAPANGNGAYEFAERELDALTDSI